jgi:hypothetical protein
MSAPGRISALIHEVNALTQIGSHLLPSAHMRAVKANVSTATNSPAGASQSLPFFSIALTSPSARARAEQCTPASFNPPTMIYALARVADSASPQFCGSFRSRLVPM